jgi:UDP-N-acetylmuramate dehydrogenase
MIVQKNVNLKNHTTLRIGGVAHDFFEPESISELMTLINSFDEANYLVLGGGSNVLINDKAEFDTVISTKRINRIDINGEGFVEAEAGVMNRQLLQFLMKHNFGGVEYLSSIPGTIGGAIVMNAGTGKNVGRYIGDYVVSVTMLYNGEIEVIEKDNCSFDFRHSVFQTKNAIVLKAVFKFPPMDGASFKDSIKKHMEMIKNTQELQKPNIGSVFNIYYPKIIAAAQRLQLGFKKGVRFSRKTPDWIVNNGHGTFCQALTLIRFIVFVHKIFMQKVRTEIVIWK